MTKKVTRWTGIVDASGNGGFVAYGDYLKLQAELAAIHKEAETNQKWAFLEWRNKAEQLEVENLGLRLECQGLKAEIAEVKSYWKESARKNAEMLAREANRLGGGL